MFAAQGKGDLLFLPGRGGDSRAAVDCQASVVAHVTQGSRGDPRESSGSSAVAAHSTKPSSSQSRTKSLDRMVQTI